jgi:N6-adenosine-specific RNA methylase IME4
LSLLSRGLRSSGRRPLFLSRCNLKPDLPKGPFAAIVADPPWSFDDKGTRLAPSYKGKQRKDKTKKHYNVLSLKDICALPVGGIAADDTYLFLWIPAALRESPCYQIEKEDSDEMWYSQRRKDACQKDVVAYSCTGFHRAVMEAWGFTPTGAEIIWIKGRIPVVKVQPCDEVIEVQPTFVLQIGGGHTVRNAHEVCVIGRRGKPTRLDKGVPSVIVASRGEHSAKPDAFYTLVERLCPGPYIDLYGRRRASDSWDVWGDEAPQKEP